MWTSDMQQLQLLYKLASDKENKELVLDFISNEIGCIVSSINDLNEKLKYYQMFENEIREK